MQLPEEKLLAAHGMMNTTRQCSLTSYFFRRHCCPCTPRCRCFYYAELFPTKMRPDLLNWPAGASSMGRFWKPCRAHEGGDRGAWPSDAEAAVGHLRTAPSMSVSSQTASRGEVPDGEQDLVEEVGAGGGGNPGWLRRGSLPPETGRGAEDNFGGGVKRAAQDREDVGWRRGGAHTAVGSGRAAVRPASRRASPPIPHTLPPSPSPDSMGGSGRKRRLPAWAEHVSDGLGEEERMGIGEKLGRRGLDSSGRAFVACRFDRTLERL
jgi:hypothetical protein